MTYYLYNDEDLSKESLIGTPEFLQDASTFLIRRGGYDLDELGTDEEIFDKFLEHFRSQDTNEVTAMKDLFYAEEDATPEEKIQMANLMTTYDRMPGQITEAPLQAIGDYAESILTAPSTGTALISFGAGKAGAVAATQGIKFGIRQALMSGGLRGATQAAALEGGIAAGSTLLQEEVRVETGAKEEVDYGNVALGGALGAIPGAVSGAVIGTQKALKQNAAERIAKLNEISKTKVQKRVNKSVTQQVKTGKKGKKVKEKYEEFVNKFSLEKTLGKEFMDDAKNVRKANPVVDEDLVQNVSAAAAEIWDTIGARPGVVAGSVEDKAERFTSRVARALNGGNVELEDKVRGILNKYSLTTNQLSYMYAAEISEAGRTLGAVGNQAKKLKDLVEELDNIDVGALAAGKRVTTEARERLKEQAGKHYFSNSLEVFKNIDKAGVATMTIQAATTIRNTTSGYMRNYMYALDNLGAGALRVAYHGGKLKLDKAGIIKIPDKLAKEEAEYAVRMGRAQMLNGAQSAMLKDMFLGIGSVESRALERLMRSDILGDSKVGKQLFRELGDISNTTGQEGGLLKVARHANILNTLSDNMFKRAIFAREVDVRLKASGVKDGLSGILKRGNFGDIEKVNPNILGDSMKQALEFTYQSNEFYKGGTIFNTLADGFIKFSNIPVVGTSFAPFAKYLVNQFKFAYEHAPIIGLVDPVGVVSKDKTIIDKTAKQITGMAAIGTFLALRTNFGDETTDAYTYKDPTSNATFNAKAAIGPFSVFALVADLIYRINPGGVVHDNEKVYQSYNIKFLRDTIEALGGGQFRGTGLDIVDKIIEVSQDSVNAGLLPDQAALAMSDFLGNYINRYTVGAGVLKDVAGQFNEDYRQLPNNKDVKFWENFFRQAGRSLPTDMSGDRERLESVTRPDGVRMFNPLMKQLTGLTPVQEKTLAEKEFARLGLDYYEQAPRKIAADPNLTNEMKGYVGEKVDAEINAFVRSDIYQSLPDDLKRVEIKKEVNRIRADARDKLFNTTKFYASQNTEMGKRLAKSKFFDLSRSNRTRVFSEYKRKYGKSLADTEDYLGALMIANDLKIKTFAD